MPIDNNEWEDLLVKELHQIRERHGKFFEYDVDKIYEDLIAQEEAQEQVGVKFVSRSKEDPIKAAS